MRYELVTDFDRFLQLRHSWNDLAADCDVDHAFMQHEWFTCWIRYLGNNPRLAVLLAWQGDVLVAAAPFHIRREKRRGLPLRVLQFLQSGITPRCNLLVRKEADLYPFVDAILDTPGWDLMDLRNMESGAATTRELVSTLTERRNCFTEPGHTSPYVVLQGTWDDFQKDCRRSLKKNFRKTANRIAKNTRSHEVVVLETPDQFRRHFSDLVTISGRSWKADVGTDLAALQADFYRNFSLEGSKSGLCIAYMLILNGEPAAFDYYLRHKKKLAGIRSDYDKRYKYFVPGTALHMHVVKDLLGKGEEWEFDLCGAASEYKAGLATDLREHVHVFAGKPGFRGRVLMRLKKAMNPNVEGPAMGTAAG